MSPTRTLAERDTLTVEIAFALVTGLFIGGIGFLAIGSAAVWAPLPSSWAGPWLRASGAIGAALFAVRVVRVLRRAQPSQPGRTNPDS
ncbi:DUF6332 family protein [Streptomyces sp. NPDC101227]|uniref:DUF6332 family protein n=1 Tax=Streptomyces sp. NPDC101227 TaxID=3366136 RepID=UPI0038179035